MPVSDFDPAVLLDSEMRRLSVKPNMTAKECRLVMAYGAAIEALKATHPQSVTPAGGEVDVPVFWMNGGLAEACRLIGDAATVHRVMLSTRRTETHSAPLYTHPPVADAALAALAAKWRSEAAFMRRNSPSRDVCKAQDTKDKCADELDAALNQRGGGCG
jgi:hypothetical protein